MTTSARTHALSVPEVGDFTFQRRTLDVQLKIGADAVRMTGGRTGDDWLEMVSQAVASLRVLTATAPDGWNLDEIDPLDPDAISDVLKVFGGLRAAEETFRSGSRPQRAPVGTGA